MKIYLVAIHYDAKVENIVGFRLLERDTKAIKDVPHADVMKVISNKSTQIVGLEIHQGKLRGSNGSLDRYTKLVNGKTHGKKAIVIIMDFGDGGYSIADWNGKQKAYREHDMLKIIKSYNIANGKVVTRENGRTFISSISGSFNEVEQRIDNDTRQVKEPVKLQVRQPVKTDESIDIPIVVEEIKEIPKQNSIKINKTCTCKQCVKPIRQTCVKSGCQDIKLFAVYLWVEYPITKDEEVGRFLDTADKISIGSEECKIAGVATLEKQQIDSENIFRSKLAIVMETKGTIESALDRYKYTSHIELTSEMGYCEVYSGLQKFEWAILKTRLSTRYKSEIKVIQNEKQFNSDKIINDLINEVKQSNSDTEIQILPKLEHSVINKNSACKKCTKHMRQKCVIDGCTTTQLFALYLQVEYPIEIDTEVAKLIPTLDTMSDGGSDGCKIASITTLDKYKVANKPNICYKLGIVLEAKYTIEGSLSGFIYTDHIKLKGPIGRCDINTTKKQFEWVIEKTWVKTVGTVEVKNIPREKKITYDQILTELINEVRKSNSATHQEGGILEGVERLYVEYQDHMGAYRSSEAKRVKHMSDKQLADTGVRRRDYNQMDVFLVPHYGESEWRYIGREGFRVTSGEPIAPYVRPKEKSEADIQYEKRQEEEAAYLDKRIAIEKLDQDSRNGRYRKNWEKQYGSII